MNAPIAFSMLPQLPGQRHLPQMLVVMFDHAFDGAPADDFMNPFAFRAKRMGCQRIKRIRFIIQRMPIERGCVQAVQRLQNIGAARASNIEIDLDR